MPNENPIDKDFLFLVECFKGFDMSRGKVDMLAVASALGYNNPHSAGNRFKALAKKHGFKVECFYKPTSTSATTPSSSPKIKRAPSKKVAAKKAARSDAKDDEDVATQAEKDECVQDDA
ncbi:hypothetical protein N7450_005088 [Penicillium hetheringtonii]|uniref:Myb-like DNA-binding domain-containing protein n=1 Tax=Penicillium hetheringtonii TaxID=911720 RepID=A0AAD6DRD8_9EURO|nr:hypothetical protein N7450_005088 [Penicillium hetheringtonii]